MTNQKKVKGFTLVELIVVLLIATAAIAAAAKIFPDAVGKVADITAGVLAVGVFFAGFSYLNDEAIEDEAAGAWCLGGIAFVILWALRHFNVIGDGIYSKGKIVIVVLTVLLGIWIGSDRTTIIIAYIICIGLMFGIMKGKDILLVKLTGDSQTEVAENQEPEETVPEFIQNPDSEQDFNGADDSRRFAVQTKIYYSAGSLTDWEYSNQRKEFSVSDSAYARITTTVAAGNAVSVNEYAEFSIIFTGTDVCDVSLSESEIKPVSTEEDSERHTKTFTFRQKASQNAQEEIYIFRYAPQKTGQISVEIQYDDSSAVIDGSAYTFNSIYFK